ncbi:MAG: hypothetical protein A2Z20_02390 [Bdellovibrionales bacterium RBG_16_40_8]|nr:MAG: hypothetical protein A2Z20_02390 [Bdellovibrionales bacterium RBG_16_40_8]
MQHTEIPIDSDLYELVPQFCDTRKKELAIIEEHLNNKDFFKVARICHSVKGIAKPYGFPTLEKLFRELEDMANAQDNLSTKKQLALIRAYFEKYCV